MQAVRVVKRGAAISKSEAAHDRKWQNARRVAMLREHHPAWWFARLMGRGGRLVCRVCGFNRQSPTTGACGWCGCESPGRESAA